MIFESIAFFIFGKEISVKEKRPARFVISILIVRAVRTAMKLFHLKATHFPGQLAKKLCPGFLAYIGKPRQIIAVTGTNGKTTVANLIADMARSFNLSFAHNAYGSNIEEGIITTLLDASSLTGKPNKPLAILEIDERFTRVIFRHLRPDYLIVTNLFRESYLRNAHGEFIFDILNDNINPETEVIVNADDLLSQGLAKGRPHTSFGIARLPGEAAFTANLIRDVLLCPDCRMPLTDRFIRYHHIGRSFCEACGWSSMTADLEITGWEQGRFTLINRLENKEESYPFKGENILDLYNALAAVTLFRRLGYSQESVADALAGAVIGKSRKEMVRAGNKTIYRMLAKGKNPIAVSRVIGAIGQIPGKKQFILLVDTSTDKMTAEDNTAWLYDADLDMLAGGDVERIIAAGRRAEDVRLALLFAGVPTDKIVTCRDKSQAHLHVLKTDEATTFAILYELYSEEVSRKVARALESTFSQGPAVEVHYED